MSSHVYMADDAFYERIEGLAVPAPFDGREFKTEAFRVRATLLAAASCGNGACPHSAKREMGVVGMCAAAVRYAVKSVKKKGGAVPRRSRKEWKRWTADVVGWLSTANVDPFYRDIRLVRFCLARDLLLPAILRNPLYKWMNPDSVWNEFLMGRGITRFADDDSGEDFAHVVKAFEKYRLLAERNDYVVSFPEVDMGRRYFLPRGDTWTACLLAFFGVPEVLPATVERRTSVHEIHKLKCYFMDASYSQNPPSFVSELSIHLFFGRVVTRWEAVG